jgi:PTS system galactitol-specific IIC component
MIVMAFILPGNKVLPVVDLVAIPYAMECIVCTHNGNLAKSVPTAIVYYIFGLLAASYLAPYFTEAARVAGFAFPEGVAMITSVAVCAKPIPTIITLAFMTQNPVLIGITVLVYVVSYVCWRKFQNPIIAYLERMAAKNEGTQPVAEIAIEA